MLRTALRPRWIALLLVVLVLASGMAWLGTWQLQRAHERSAEAVAERQTVAPVAVTDLLRARQTFPGKLVDRPVLARGTWDGQHQLLVAGKQAGGVSGFWVLTPLVLEDGSAVAVVRGRVASPADPAVAAVSGPVTVRGILKPGDAPAERAPGQTSGLPAGQVAGVAPADLVKVWPYPLLTGYVVAQQVTPATQPAPTPVPTVAPGEGGLALQNLSYALQWWVFAGFGLFVWWRLVRDDHRGLLAPASPAPEGVGDDGTSQTVVPGARQ